MKRILQICTLFFLLCGVLSSVYAQPKLYWGDSTTIWRGNLDGTNIELIKTNIDSLTALSVNSGEFKLYWSTKTRVWRSDLDGNNTTLIYAGNQITDMTIDSALEKIFVSPPLLSISLDGTQLDTISSRNFERFTLNIQDQKVYGKVDNRIQSTTLNLSDPNRGLIPLFDVGSFDDLQMLPQSRRLYWIDAQNAAIRRGSLLGTQATTVLNDGLVNVSGFVVDEESENIYWTTKSRPSSTVSTIYMADIDGRNIKEVTSVSSSGGWVKDMWIYYPASGNASFGDVNGDGQIDSVDVILILRSSIGLENLTHEQQIRADVNGDGTIDSRDGTLILRRIINLISSFPVESQ